MGSYEFIWICVVDLYLVWCLYVRLCCVDEVGVPGQCAAGVLFRRKVFLEFSAMSILEFDRMVRIVRIVHQIDS